MVIMMLSWRHSGLTQKVWMQPVGEAGYLCMQQLKELSPGAAREVKSANLPCSHLASRLKMREVSDAASSDCWTRTVLSFVYHLFIEDKVVAGSHQAWGPSHGGWGSQHSIARVPSTRQRDSTTPQGMMEIGYIRV